MRLGQPGHGFGQRVLARLDREEHELIGIEPDRDPFAELRHVANPLLQFDALYEHRPPILNADPEEALSKGR